MDTITTDWTFVREGDTVISYAVAGGELVLDQPAEVTDLHGDGPHTYSVTLDSGVTLQFPRTGRVTIERPEYRVIDMDAIADLVKAQGIPCYVEQTGGGCATIYAGTPVKDDDGMMRYAAVAGPGWFSGIGFSDARGTTAEFLVGPDDDGQSTPWTTQPDSSDHDIATNIVEFARLAMTQRITTADVVAILQDDLGVEATNEYPGFVSIPVDDTYSLATGSERWDAADLNVAYVKDGRTHIDTTNEVIDLPAVPSTAREAALMWAATAAALRQGITFGKADAS